MISPFHRGVSRPFALLPLLLIGCTPLISSKAVTESDGVAEQTIRMSADAHGSVFEQLHDVNVRFEGTWLSFVAKVQPVLVDEQFRGQSEERFLLRDGIIAQEHQGPGGVKRVLRNRTNRSIQVWYNGAESTDKDVLAAASSVADCYRLFLIGPGVLIDQKATFSTAESTTIDGCKCDQVLAVLKPGMGQADEDRVLVAIDQKTHLAKRYRITLNGMESTKGAIADITVGDYVRVSGAQWPTSYYEEVQRPLNIAAHRWRLLGIDVDRGLRADDLSGATLKGPATRPAGAAKIEDNR